jgi:hypothetical protein
MNIDALHLHLMVTTIGCEILHVNEDIDFMLSFIKDGEYASEDLENAQLLSRSIKELSVLVKEWKPRIIDRI